MFRELGHDIDEEECRDMLFCFDLDSDSQISFKEFVQVMLYKSDDQTVFFSDDAPTAK